MSETSFHHIRSNSCAVGIQRFSPSLDKQFLDDWGRASSNKDFDCLWTLQNPSGMDEDDEGGRTVYVELKSRRRHRVSGTSESSAVISEAVGREVLFVPEVFFW